MAHPIDQRRQAFRLCAVEHLPPIGTLGDQPSLLQRFQMLRDGALGDSGPARELQHGDFIGPGDAFINGPSRGVGQSSHDVGDGNGLDHEIKLANTNELVNANMASVNPYTRSPYGPTISLDQPWTLVLV